MSDAATKAAEAAQATTETIEAVEDQAAIAIEAAEAAQEAAEEAAEELAAAAMESERGRRIDTLEQELAKWRDDHGSLMTRIAELETMVKSLATPTPQPVTVVQPTTDQPVVSSISPATTEQPIPVISPAAVENLTPAAPEPQAKAKRKYL